jgi:hypothetical protein
MHYHCLYYLTKTTIVFVLIDAGASLHISQPASQPRQERAFKAKGRGAASFEFEIECN